MQINWTGILYFSLLLFIVKRGDTHSLQTGIFIYMYVTLWHIDVFFIYIYNYYQPHIFERGGVLGVVVVVTGKLESQVMTVTFFFAYWYWHKKIWLFLCLIYFQLFFISIMVLAFSKCMKTILYMYMHNIQYFIFYFTSFVNCKLQ